MFKIQKTHGQDARATEDGCAALLERILLCTKEQRTGSFESAGKMSEELSKVYEPKITEEFAQKIWEGGNFFHARTGGGKNYCIVIPPPNVTAPLHLGHALNNTLQDILIRFHRMRQYATLWMPGTDHAGIATQTVVEKRILAEEGKRRTDFKREVFVGRVQAWKDEYEARILEQLKAMGCSCDWQRTRFTMDEVCAKAVRAAFFKLFKDGLIYRGKRLVNWDPATQTVLADDEVEHETVKGHFWYLRYPLEEPVEIPRGTGFQPVQDNVNKRNGAYLPHWTKKGATYAVTFRLVDSMPAEVTEQWRVEREKIIQNAASQGRELSSHEQQELERLYSDKVESYLNAGHGQCYLRENTITELVANAFKHFDGERYDLIAWVIMPNHVHVIVKPYEGIELSEILHSWKSFTATQANKILGRKEDFWYGEYYDHLIRDEEDFYNQVNYVLSNPSKAGLENWPWVGAKKEMHGQDAHATKHGQDARVTYVTVATTRPETMLGDTAVAMNPADPRAKYLVGKTVRLPIVGRIIPIIADEHVVLPDLDNHGQDGRDTNHGQDARATNEKAKYSTGFLKVTPAHDPDDWAIGQRHNLAVINIMAPDGSISDKHGWEDWEQIKNPDAKKLIGMDRFKAREAVVEWFRNENLLEDVKEYIHEVGHSYRSHVPIEPYLSDQWYIAVKKPIEQGSTGFQPQIIHEDTGKMPVPRTMAAPQGFIEGTDVPANSLAGFALKPLLDGRLRFIPERYANTYKSWLENLRDWPISRQLWWGHQIPVWKVPLDNDPFDKSDKVQTSCSEDNLRLQFESRLNELAISAGLERDSFCCRVAGNFAEAYVCPRTNKGNNLLKSFKEFVKSWNSDEFTPGQEIPLVQSRLNDFPNANIDFAHKLAHMVHGLEQDEDVLDTWFSSALWPFSTLGWPDETAELKTYYPGNVLCTAREIITLWVSRMVMMGQYCAGDIPFSDVYIHAMIQDGEGRKMSKSLGNGIDPLVVIDSHGADAMRFTLASMTTETQDIRMPVVSMALPDGRVANTSPKFDIGRNFCNKLWNASRFAMMNLEGINPERFDKNKMTVVDRWILSRLAKTISETTKSLENYQFSEPLSALYKFFWNDFCDWYLEWVKSRMQDEEQRPIAQNVLAFVLDQSLRLLHPFVPFITEGIFQKLNEISPVRQLKGMAESGKPGSLAIAEWPRSLDFLVNEDAEKEIELIQTAVKAIRDIRSSRNIHPKEKLAVSAKSQQEYADTLNRNAGLIEELANVKDFRAGTDTVKPDNAAAAITEAAEIYVHNAIDAEAERTKLKKQKEQVENQTRGIEAKLANENFVAKAKPAVVQQTKEKLAELTEQLKTIEKHLTELEKK